MERYVAFKFELLYIVDEMNRNLSLAKALSIVAMFVTLWVAHLLDQWLEHARQIRSQTFNTSPYLWSYAITNLVLALFVAVLIWLVFFKAGRSRVVGLIFLGFGLIFSLLPVLYLTVPALSTSFPRLAHTMITFAPTTLFSKVSAIVFGIGILSLILRRA